METSVARSTTHISLLNVDAEKWDELSQKEQAEKIEKAMKGLSGSEREEMKDQLLDVIADLTESVKESRKDLRKSRHRDKEKGAKRDELVEELDELILSLKDLKNDVNAAMTNLKRHEQTHDRDVSGGEDLAVLDLELGKPDEDIEKHTYVYRLGGEMAAFDDDRDLSDHDYLLEQGVINQDGVVIKDVKKDEALNQMDIDEALKERNDVMTKQKVTVRLKPGQRISLSNYDAESGETVLKVEDERGNFAYLRFENAKNAVFTFNRGFTLDQARGWPEGFLKQVHQNSKKSLNEKFNPTALSQEEKLAVIPGFTKIQHELNGLYGYTHATPDDNLTWKAKEVIDVLYGFLDGGDLSQNKLYAVWEQINGMLNGLDETSRSKVLELAIVAIAKFSPQNFGRLFGPVVGRLEQVLAASGSEEGEPSTGAKLAIMLLETKAAPGNYGGGEIWKKYVVDKPNEAEILGKWKNKVSTIDALRSFGDIVNHMDGRLPFDVEEMASRVEGAYATAEDAGESGEETSSGDSGKKKTGKNKTTPAKDHNPSFQSAKEEFESKLTWARANAGKFTSFVHTNEGEWNYFINQMAIHLFEEDGSLKKDPLGAVLNFLETIDDDGADHIEYTDHDTLIAGLIRYVNWQLSAEFNNAFIPRMKDVTLDWFKNDGGSEGRDESLARWILNQYPSQEAE